MTRVIVGGNPLAYEFKTEKRVVDAEAFERLLGVMKDVESYLRVGFQAHSTADTIRNALDPFQPDESAGVIEAMNRAMFKADGFNGNFNDAISSIQNAYHARSRAALDAYLTYDGPKPMPRKENDRG